MSFVSSWLKEVIAVILLAGFIDLVLPNRSMERYVKLVFSLFILLTLLSPLVKLMRLDPNVNLLAASLPFDKSGMMDETVKPLDAVLKDGERMKEETVQKSIEHVETAMAGLIREQVERETGKTVRQATVQVEQDKQGSVKVKSIAVVISNDPVKTEAAATNGGMAARPVKPIEPVKIEVQIGKGKAEPASAQAQSETVRKLQDQVRDALVKQWDVRRDTIEVSVEQGKDLRS